MNEHTCPPETKVEHDGPYYRGSFAEGQEYMGAHQYYERRCVACSAVIGLSAHAGPCVDQNEARMLGSHWSVQQQTFVQPYGGAAPGWPNVIEPEVVQQIRDYFAGLGERPTRWSSSIAVTPKAADATRSSARRRR